ncbi:hypothetical protein BAE44_0022791, partial [Dichanthelium oligosanthes]
LHVPLMHVAAGMVDASSSFAGRHSQERDELLGDANCLASVEGKIRQTIPDCLTPSISGSGSDSAGSSALGGCWCNLKEFSERMVSQLNDLSGSVHVI